MTFPTISAGTRANEAVGGYANFIAYANALAAGVDSVTTTAAGAALKANNLSDLASASTARTNLGLGTAAVADTGTGAGTVAAGDDSRIVGAAQKAANLTDLTDAALARAALGLGSASQSATTDFDAAGSAATAQSAAQSYAAALVDDLSGVTDAVAARAALGLGTMATASASAYAALAGATFTAATMIDGSANAIQLRVQGHSTQTTDYFRVETSAGTSVGGWDQYGQLTTQYVTNLTSGGPYIRLQSASQIAINSGNAANVPWAVRGMAAQSGDLFQAQNSSGTALANIYSDGSFLTPKIYVGSAGVGNSGSFGYASYEPLAGGSRINTSTQTNVALTVRNSHASASGKLQSWQVTTSDTEVASISAAGKVTGATATTSTASFRAPHGTAPTSPVDGDMWTTTAGLYVRINGATVGPLS